MFIRIGSVEITRIVGAQYTVQSYAGGSIGIRGRVKSGADLKTTEEKLYLLREGRMEEVEVQTDDGKVFRGSYKINELNWKKERKDTGDYELVFNIGLQKQ
jgi:hypothetical protein